MITTGVTSPIRSYPVGMKATTVRSCSTPDTDDTIVVNETGKTVWELLRTPRTPDEVASYLKTKYDIGTEHRPAEEVEAFLQTLAPGFVSVPGAAS